MSSSHPLSLGNQWFSYSEMYRRQLWVSVVVGKRAGSLARLPLKVYLRDELNRPEATDSPYAKLLAKPSTKHSRFFFWQWITSTRDIFGEAFAGKVRDPGGRPIELVLLHPTGMHPDKVPTGAEQTWTFRNGEVEILGIRQSDLVHFKTYNPDDTMRGMSPLEPLRRTLEFEDAAQRAQSSFWRRGARPAVALSTDKELSQAAATRLRVQWDEVAAGADNTGRTVVLEQGLKPEKWQVTNEEAQYIDSRKLNREEVCAGYDVPPPVVHILDRATFSNITEQMRSMYRDTMAPLLKSFEETLEHDLRSSVRPGASEPDFGDDVYAEFLLDEVLRGDFEARADAYQKSDFMTIAEKRQRENLPFIEGTDRVFVNAATVPLVTAPDGEKLSPTELATAIQKIYLGVDTVVTADEAREILNRAGADLAGSLPGTTVRSLMGRLSRVSDLSEVDPDALVAGLPDADLIVRSLLASAIDAGHTVPEFRQGLKALAGG
jgi:HK97 family phage portal protein